MATKICKVASTIVDSVVIYSTEDERSEPTPRIIAPDDAGTLWYWHLTPEDIEAEHIAQAATLDALRAAES